MRFLLISIIFSRYLNFKAKVNPRCSPNIRTLNFMLNFGRSRVINTDFCKESELNVNLRELTEYKLDYIALKTRITNA